MECRDFDLQEQISLSFGDEPIRGVYELFLGGDLVYVGQSKNVQNRIMTHIREGNLMFDSFNMTKCEVGDLNDIEARYIVERKPLKNKVIPPNSMYCSESTLINIVTDFIRSKASEMETIHTTELGKSSRSRYVRKPSIDELRDILSKIKYTLEV